MLKFSKILAPTDLSELSLVGLRYAVEMAESQGAEVVIYHVIGQEEVVPFYSWAEGMVGDEAQYKPFRDLVEEHRQRFANFFREKLSGISARLRIRSAAQVGIPHRKIVEKAAEENVDLIVMSTHGRTGMRHVLLGSVAEQVVRRSHCPVLIVRSPIREQDGERN